MLSIIYISTLYFPKVSLHYKESIMFHLVLLFNIASKILIHYHVLFFVSTLLLCLVISLYLSSHHANASTIFSSLDSQCLSSSSHMGSSLLCSCNVVL